ncbi:MAG: M15 family metallopeptidase [Candidatus Merdivicinus sp.]|jgi:D-alanyl-D-alanine carboxypeptidase
MSRYRRRLRWNRIFAVIIAGGLVATAAYLVQDSFHTLFPSAAEESQAEESVQESAVTESTVTESSEVSEAEQFLPEGWKWINLSKEKLHQGELILVNNQTAFEGEAPETVSIYDVKTASYQVKDTLVTIQEKVAEQLNAMLDDFYAKTGLSDVMIISGWRGVDKQDTLYQDDLLETGQNSSTLVAKPGYSEHHTGLALDLGLLPEIEGVGRSYDGQGAYSWINENCGEYGFILRYPEDKMAETGIEYEPWHFRYVGTPHSQIIMEKGICLEEYLEFLKEYPVNGTHYETDTYEICWQEAQETPQGDYRVAVPENGDYTTSGDNMGGVIVTIQK